MPILTFSFLLSLFLNPVPAQNDDWEKIRSIAESQHEIVMLLIKNKSFDEVSEETGKIFSLAFPVEQQHLLVEEAKEICDALLHHNQHSLASAVLEQALAAVDSPSLKAAVYKEQAYVQKKMGNDEEAMRLFKKAVELEKKPGYSPNARP